MFLFFYYYVINYIKYIVLVNAPCNQLSFFGEKSNQAT